MRLGTILLAVSILATATTGKAQQLKTSQNFKAIRHASVKKASVKQSLSLRPVTGAVKKEKCGFASYMKRAEARGFNNALFETELKKLVKRRIESGKTAFTGIVTIPVVFHSLYRNGQALSATSPNLIASQYQAQIDELNNDYANLAGSAYGVSADVRIRFCLAVVDTAGRVMTEPGIDRINATTRGWSNTNSMDDVTLEDYFETTIKPESIWDPYSYFNVWTAAMTSSGLLGYASFPALSTLDGLSNSETSDNAGVVVSWETIGSIDSPGTDPDFGYGRTLTHEAGHFFGLRHIWGDDNCGEDYCADTPPQDDATSGCPATGTLNNCTPSGPKMFENYMDYSNDACLNTFTANQALRCQTAMDNSPRRLSLITSKVCQARAGNAIQFARAAPYVVSETGNSGACPNTRSYTFNLYVSSAATGNATVTFAPTANSTAVLNTDYTISSAVTYTNGDAAVKSLTITIIDDQAIEASELIEIGYSISGTGVSAGPGVQTVALYILDDDINGITINNTKPVDTLLNETFSGSTNIPAGWSTAVLDDGVGGYTPNQWVINNNGGLGTSGNSAHISRNTSTKPNTYDSTNISDAYLFTPLLDASGLDNINIQFRWRCNGEVGFDEGYVGIIPEGQAVDPYNVLYFDTAFSGMTSSASARLANLRLPAEFSNSKFYLVFNWYNDDNIGANPPFTIDNVIVSGSHLSVASTTDADTALSQFSGQTVNYYSSSNTSRIIATLSNVNQNIGCITASVQSAGSGKTVLATTTGSYFRTDKVIKLTPAAANTTAQYQATLYYSTAELSPTWTAGEIAALKILKVKDGVNLSGTLTPSDAVLVTPTFSNQSANGYYSYTGNFTGFSQFMLVSPNTVLPVSLIKFDAKADKHIINLGWSTSQETNNKGFTVERSTDAASFTAIGWVNGNGTTASESKYSFADNFVQPGITYYYRLRQMDLDGRETFSEVEHAAIDAAGISVKVNPVPARDVLNVYISGTSQAASLRLYNAQGQLMKTLDNINTFNSAYKLKTGDLPSGMYILNVVLPGSTILKKVMIER